MNLRGQAEADLSKTLEDKDGAGTVYTLIDRERREFVVTGVVGDISVLFSSEGESIRNRTIRCSCRILSLAEKTDAVPRRGWRARIPYFTEDPVDLYVTGCDPDRTLGIYHLNLALDLEAEEEE